MAITKSDVFEPLHGGSCNLTGSARYQTIMIRKRTEVSVSESEVTCRDDDETDRVLMCGGFNDYNNIINNNNNIVRLCANEITGARTTSDGDKKLRSAKTNEKFNYNCTAAAVSCATVAGSDDAAVTRSREFVGHYVVICTLRCAALSHHFERDQRSIYHRFKFAAQLLCTSRQTANRIRNLR